MKEEKENERSCRTCLYGEKKEPVHCQFCKDFSGWKMTYHNLEKKNKKLKKKLERIHQVNVDYERLEELEIENEEIKSENERLKALIIKHDGGTGGVVTQGSFNALCGQNSEIKKKNEKLVKLLRLEREYRNLILQELSETSGLAAIHGWYSTKIEKGKRLREEIKKVMEE